jgi:alkaline phosphatase
MLVKKKLKLHEVFKVLALFFVFFSCVLFSQSPEKPKNIILLIGDGMGTNYVSAAVLSFHDNPFRKFTSIGFSITSAANKLVTESAAAATAISTGYRTDYYYVGIDTLGNPINTIFEEAERLGLSTGLVVTSNVTNATPAAFVAHVLNRKDETTIAKQFLDLDIDLVIGGGAKYFNRADSISFRTHFDELRNNGYEIYTNSDELFANHPEDKFYALLEEEHLKKASERNYSLSNLTQRALENLSLSDQGFVLMVEGSQIDWGGHENNQDYILSELKDFCGAVNLALDFADKDENTLVLVTADHETGGMSINGGNLDGSELAMKFTTTGHTAGMVGVFAKGPGEELFRGIYENFILGRNLFRLLNPNYSF